MARTVTAREYEALLEGFTDIQIIETEGMLITRAFERRLGYVLALQPFGGQMVTLMRIGPLLVLQVLLAKMWRWRPFSTP